MLAACLVCPPDGKFLAFLYLSVMRRKFALWILLILVLSALWIIGAVHSIQMHRHEDPDMMWATPAAIYRGIELFWH